MGLIRSQLVTLLLYVLVVNEIRLPLVTCQNEDSIQCMPRTTFLSLLRLPEVNPNLAAYSRTVRVDTRNRNDIARLRALAEESDDPEICVPSRVYSQLYSNMDPGFAMNGRTQRFTDLLGRLYDDNLETELLSESQKRSIAMLAKNDDLPISIQDRLGEKEDDQEKRAVISSNQSGSGAEIPQDYLLHVNQNSEESVEKRNVGTLARDFALPPGRRNIASLVRDYELQSKSNKTPLVPLAGKRNVASLARTFTLPQNGKRNVASVARNYGLPYGKRYVGSLARIGDFPVRDQRSVASLAKNSAWPVTLKRGLSVPGTVILRALSRHGRSLSDELNARNYLLDLQELVNQNEDYEDGEKSNDYETRDGMSDRRLKRQIDFSDDYPLPVMQNTNVFDYEEMMEALNGQYPNAEKRFLGPAVEMPSVDQFGYPETFQASKRHIGSLARSGWLPSIRAARFSRSPRYLISRENPADGPSSDYSIAPSPRSLRRNFNARSFKQPQGYIQALQGDCRHGFKRFLGLPTTDNYLRQKLPSSPRTI
ncbi:neuropeptide-like precursor 1 isoform X2 [Osmia lignaria lignaria]|uniref:neuropeptide-like precursor 1 isoform X2 n=1 Tax=Osmia lignaria lignaria TaxID=1437193 RepID=UPI00402BB143